MFNMLFDVDVSRVSNAVAAGTSDVNGTAVDMTDWDGVLFVAALGTLTTTHVTKLLAQGGAASDGSDAVTLVGSTTDQMADGDSNKLICLDVVRAPGVRYIRPVLDRGTANAVLDGIVAIRYRNRKGPVTQGSTVSQSLVSVSPEVSNAALTSSTITPSGTTTKLNTTSRTSS